MIETEKKSNRINRKAALEKELKKRFNEVEINGETCFLKETGEVFHVDDMGGEFDAIVIEYAQNEAEANLGRYEDGDPFYMDEMDEAEMLDAILKEIDS